MIEAELEARQINDRTVFVVFDTGDAPLADKVAAAADGTGRSSSSTSRMRATGPPRCRCPMRRSRSAASISTSSSIGSKDAFPKPSFTGIWYRVFEGGCITYEFDAAGPGVDRLAGDVDEALGLFPAGEVRAGVARRGHSRMTAEREHHHPALFDEKRWAVGATIALYTLAAVVMIWMALGRSTLQPLDDWFHDSMVSIESGALTFLAKVFNYLGSTWVTLPLRVGVAGLLWVQKRWEWFTVWLASIALPRSP